MISRERILELRDKLFPEVSALIDKLSPVVGMPVTPNDMIIDAIAICDLALKTPQWQPIETAPRDGTEIWLLSEEGQYQAHLEQSKSDAVHQWEPYWKPLTLPSHGCGCCCGEDVEPTHWMPLPAPYVTE